MGLGVIAYEHIIKADGNEAFDETGEVRDGWFQIHVNNSFPGREDRLKHLHAYRSVGGVIRFRAGSYGAYNGWREQLAELAGWPRTTHVLFGVDDHCYTAGAWSAAGGPFWELINFSDCEGVIGPATSAKLAKDFSDFQEKVDLHPDEWFKKKYSEWRKSFELAANNGVVVFH